MDKTYINGITLGIKHTRSFRVGDITGEIIDDILHNEKSPFDVKYFPRIQDKAGREKTLYNENNEYIRVNTDDVISFFVIDDDFDKKIIWIKNTVIPYFEQLFADYKIKRIERLGVIFHHSFEKTDKLIDVVKTLTDDKVSETNSINLSFSKRLPQPDGNKKGVIDYKNVINTFQQDGDKLYYDFDFQYYYSPIIDDLRMCKYADMIEEGKNYLVSAYNGWLKQYGKQEK